MLHVSLELFQAHRLSNVQRWQHTGGGLRKQFRREPAGQLVAGGRQTSIPVVVDDSGTALRLLSLAGMLARVAALRLRLLAGAHAERGRNLLHVLVANGALLLLLLSLLQQLLQMRSHLALVVRLLRLLWLRLLQHLLLLLLLLLGLV